MRMAYENSYVSLSAEQKKSLFFCYYRLLIYNNIWYYSYENVLLVTIWYVTFEKKIKDTRFQRFGAIIIFTQIIPNGFYFTA